MEYVYWYLLTGLSIYTIAAIKNYRMYFKAEVDAVMRGVLGIFAWPLVIWSLV